METMITPTLDQVLASVVQQLANFFGTTTTAIMNDMPEFLTIFAWYNTINKMGWFIPFVILTNNFTTAFIWFISDGWEEENLPKFLKIGLWVGIGISVFILGKDIILCIICPEIVGGMALLEQLGYLIK